MGDKNALFSFIDKFDVRLSMLFISPKEYVLLAKNNRIIDKYPVEIISITGITLFGTRSASTKRIVDKVISFI